VGRPVMALSRRVRRRELRARPLGRLHTPRR
jgi:hypothetical protein